MPTRLHGAPSSWIWNGIGAMVCGIAGYSMQGGLSGGCARRAMLLCTGAIGAGLTLDAMRSPVDAILDICGGT
ncbi:hypothetical protein LAN32_25410, partial [Mycobacterium tuberculosis]|nr:hypothetical protein [Mycobacterium tuberculosis]